MSKVIIMTLCNELHNIIPIFLCKLFFLIPVAKTDGFNFLASALS